MKEYDYKKLQNGSDIRGVALEGIEGEKVNLGKTEAAALTSGFIRWLCDKTGKKPGEGRNFPVYEGIRLVAKRKA